MNDFMIIADVLIALSIYNLIEGGVKLIVLCLKTIYKLEEDENDAKLDV